MESYQFPSTYTAISGLLDDVDNSKQWNFELWHYCIKATIYIYTSGSLLFGGIWNFLMKNCPETDIFYAESENNKFFDKSIAQPQGTES